MTRVVGPLGGRFISAGIAVSTFGFLNLVILVTPRVFQAMAADGVFLQGLARLHPRDRTPTRASAVDPAPMHAIARGGARYRGCSRASPRRQNPAAADAREPRRAH